MFKGEIRVVIDVESVDAADEVREAIRDTLSELAVKVLTIFIVDENGAVA